MSGFDKFHIMIMWNLCGKRYVENQIVETVENICGNQDRIPHIKQVKKPNFKGQFKVLMNST